MSSIAIINVAIFDGSGEAVFKGEVLIDGARIAEVARAPRQVSRDGARVIDGRGRAGDRSAVCAEDLHDGLRRGSQRHDGDLVVLESGTERDRAQCQCRSRLRRYPDSHADNGFAEGAAELGGDRVGIPVDTRGGTWR